MELELNKSYRLRNGERVTLTRYVETNDQYPWRDDKQQRSWTKDGRWFKMNPKHYLDIVAEWDDPEKKSTDEIDLRKLKPEDIIHEDGHEVVHIIDRDINARYLIECYSRFLVIWDDDGVLHYNLFSREGKEPYDDLPSFKLKPKLVRYLKPLQQVIAEADNLLVIASGEMSAKNWTYTIIPNMLQHFGDKLRNAPKCHSYCQTWIEEKEEKMEEN